MTPASLRFGRPPWDSDLRPPACDRRRRLVNGSRIETFSSTDRPRERLAAAGPSALSDAELLALVLGTGHPALGDACDVARTLLDRFGGLRGVFGASGRELAGAPGVGRARAASLIAAAELGRRLASAPLEIGARLTCSREVFDHFAPLLADVKRECFYALLLDAKNRILAKVRISEGSLGASLVHPREAFRPAVREAAAAVLFLHNHPSGDATPSEEDRRTTMRLKEAGELLGIPVLDHVVIGRQEYFSFADRGW
ncbi:MAG: JAB domain-containing protein [Deltaproteobacteria bacterium]|nr:MAG: JAB domain-containing protein [Deltaproteobacteria bacterium]